ncbi:hypothetical protein [Alkalicoccobacillus porphyridii]|uniref:Uncharacterized protein n=1 Tax=Alkalicoccobacillus porphyridii TaxID=2597270 RepID=A0A554A3B1_9BACI|nr:hypothetical protein [Alkalicoccobacillus porphyridii]TSB48179.1 hypothetical protein FN960_01085 [Alkalicoccobacillus porphyridii]
MKKTEVMMMADKHNIEEEIIEIVQKGNTSKLDVAEEIIQSRNLESFEAFEIIDSMVNEGQLIKENETIGDYEIKVAKKA